MEGRTPEQAAAAARGILLEQMKILQEQTNRMIKANSATPAANIAALSHEMAEIATAIISNGWRADR